MSDCKYPEDNISYFENDLNCYEEKPHTDDSCNHEDNCHHEDHCHHHEDHHHCDEIKCCTDCAPFKPNCKPECCSGLPKVVPDLNNVKAVPVLTNRIFDCIKLENPNFAITEQTFNITSTPPTNTQYSGNICVDKVCVKYNAIGPVFNSDGSLYQTPGATPFISVCSNEVIPQAIPGSSIPYPNNQPFYISNNLVFSTTNTSCCFDYHHHAKEGRKCRVVEQNIPFRILGLKIVVTGRIGCLPFTAEYELPENMEPTGLGLPNIYNFYGKLCVPQSNSGVTIKENFESCLSIDCVEPVGELNGAGTTDAPYTFNANIETSLLIKKTIYALAEEKLSVLTIPIPRNQQCHKQDHDNTCSPCSYDRD